MSKYSTVHPKDEIWNILAETDRQIAKFSIETGKKIKELSAVVDKNTEGLKVLRGLFETQWGRFMESLVEGDLIRILRDRGIYVTETYPNAKCKFGKDQWEYDIIAANGKEVVVVEVKTTLKVQAVRDFLKNLKLFRARLPKFKENTIYGPMAYLRGEEKSTVFAEKQGLFVIRATGNSASLINKEDFKPKSFS